MQAKSFWHINEKSSEIRTEIITNDSVSNPIVVNSCYSAISLGTEKLVALGKVPVALHEKMKVPYMTGDFSFPIKYGYSLIGKTLEDKMLHTMHPHQDVAFIDKNRADFFAETIDSKTATQFSNLETVINAIWISKVNSKHRVLVCGIGSIGILLAQTLKHYIKAEVSVRENNLAKRDALKNWGFTLCEETSEYDICFNVSAHQEGLQYCIDHTVTEGKIIELSWYGTQPVQLILGVNFHYKRLHLISSQVSDIPLEFQNEHTFQTRKKLAEELLQQIDYSKFITRIIPFEELPSFFKEIRDGKTNSDFITIVKY